MSQTKHSNRSVAETLCQACGLCCNGVIFADVQLQPGDHPARLEALGLVWARASARPSASPPPAGSAGTPTPPPAGLKFSQPCAAFDGCRCRIYAERPNYCRAFVCALLKRVQVGRVTPSAALEVIREARHRADKVRRLLAALGDTDEHLALALRFRRVSKRLRRKAWDDQTADTFGELTLAVHDLNLWLGQRFYPGALVPGPPKAMGRARRGSRNSFASRHAASSPVRTSP